MSIKDISKARTKEDLENIRQFGGNSGATTTAPEDDIIDGVADTTPTSSEPPEAAAGQQGEKPVFNQIEYQNEYNRQKYDRINLTMKKGKKAEVKGAAAVAKQSVNEFINAAIDTAIERLIDEEHGKTAPEKAIFAYGMRLRGYSIGAQPKDGFLERIDDHTGKYHDIIIYSRRLSDDEVSQYELDPVS